MQIDRLWNAANLVLRKEKTPAHALPMGIRQTYERVGRPGGHRQNINIDGPPSQQLAKNPARICAYTYA